MGPPGWLGVASWSLHARPTERGSAPCARVERSARWQIELHFKRIKSLLRLGHLPKRSDESARAWIQGKLLTVLLIERLIEDARFFSPWGSPIST